MIYKELAPFYDALVKDDEATQAWGDFVTQHLPKGELLELACGSGEISILLAKLGYTITATDISDAMLMVAKTKTGHELLDWKQMDMRSFQDIPEVDGILCFCDSLNYLLEEEDIARVFKQSYKHLKDGGTFLFDVHSMDRLKEFADEYIEDGYMDEVAYQWSITCENEYLFHTFAFYDQDANAHLEQHRQRVYDPMWLKQQAEDCGFHVDIFTDFTQAGICEGEKYFYICRKEAKR